MPNPIHFDAPPWPTPRYGARHSPAIDGARVEVLGAGLTGLDQALRTFKEQSSSTLRELRKRRSFTGPALARKLKSARAAMRRRRTR